MSDTCKKITVSVGLVLQSFTVLLVAIVFMLLSGCTVKEIRFMQRSESNESTSIPIQVEVRMSDLATPVSMIGVRILDEELNQYQGRSGAYGFFTFQAKRMPSELWAWYAQTPDGGWLRVVNPTLYKIPHTDVIRATLVLVPVQMGVQLPPPQERIEEMPDPNTNNQDRMAQGPTEGINE